MRVRGGLLALASAIGALALAGPAWATFPGGNGFIVFQSNRDGDFDLFAQNLDGSGLRKLVERPGTNEFNASWNRSGGRLVFQSGPTNGSDFDLYLVNADGTGLTPLLTGATNDQAAQFCDDDTVVFTRRFSPVSTDVYAIETDGTGLRQLTDDPAVDGFPTCHPNGKKVAFHSSRSGSFAIYEIPLGPAPAGRTTLAAEPVLLVPATSLEPDYSADGKYLAYAGLDPFDGGLDVFRRNLASGATEQLSSLSPPRQGRLPKFLPGGASAQAKLLGQVPDHPLTYTDYLTDDEQQVVSTEPCPPVGGQARTPLGADFCISLIFLGSAAVAQPVPKCTCEKLDVTVPKKGFSTAEDVGQDGSLVSRLFFSLDWNLDCIPGIGPKSCKGTVKIKLSQGFKLVESYRYERRGKKKKRIKVPVPLNKSVRCEGLCDLGGAHDTIHIEMDSPKSFARLRVFFFDVITTCDGKTVSNRFTVQISGSGKVTQILRLHPGQP